jgi:hypothetical protein
MLAARQHRGRSSLAWSADLGLGRSVVTTNRRPGPVHGDHEITVVPGSAPLLGDLRSEAVAPAARGRLRTCPGQIGALAYLPRKQLGPMAQTGKAADGEGYGPGRRGRVIYRELPNRMARKKCSLNPPPMKDWPCRATLVATAVVEKA